MATETLKSATIEEARAVKEQAYRIFARDAAVVGVGIARFGEGYGVKVNLSESPKRGVRLPEEVGGVPVKVEVVGAVRKR
jgi:hypothetical protein